MTGGVSGTSSGWFKKDRAGVLKAQEANARESATHASGMVASATTSMKQPEGTDVDCRKRVGLVILTPFRRGALANL